MGLYIKGIDIPTEGSITVSVHSDGSIYVYGVYPTELHKAVSVSIPHGRLIDADAVLSQYNGSILTARCDYAEGLRDAAEDIKTAPTIIEAEEGDR